MNKNKSGLLSELISSVNEPLISYSSEIILSDEDKEKLCNIDWSSLAEKLTTR